MSTYPHNNAPIPVPDIENWNLDRTVEPATKVFGIMQKSGSGSWQFMSYPTAFQVSTVGMATSAVNYSTLLPSNTKMVDIKVRGLEGKTVSCATVSAVSANSFFTVADSQNVMIGGPGCNFGSQSLFFASDTSSTTMELIIYT